MVVQVSDNQTREITRGLEKALKERILELEAELAMWKEAAGRGPGPVRGIIETLKARAEKAEAEVRRLKDELHHLRHGDMDGSTCLLSKCAVHYPDGGGREE